MTHRPLRLFSLMTAVLLAAPAMAQVRIELRADAAVRTDEILLGDVADISGGTAQARAQLSSVNVAMFRKDEPTRTIRQSLIAIHLQLAGWSADSFQLTGPGTVRVSRSGPERLSDMTIEAAAAATIQAALNLPAEDLRVRLSSPFTTSLPGVLQKDEHLTVKVLPPLSSRLGGVPLTVQLWQGSRLVHSRAGRFEVYRRHQVVVSRTSLPRNHIITDEDVQAEVRFLATPADQFQLHQVVGQKVRTNVPAAAIISRRHLQPAAAPQKEQIIRQRDNVQVTAVNGRLKVKLTSAQALQSGRKGDTIRVRNLKSNEVLTGKVTAPGHVEIRL